MSLVPVLRGSFSAQPDGMWRLQGTWAMNETDPVTSNFEFVQRAGDGPPTAAAAPPSSLYDGYFMMKRLNQPEMRVEERGVAFRFDTARAGATVPGTAVVLQPGDVAVHASGSNEFGTFELRGRYAPASREAVLGKVYTAFGGGGAATAKRSGSVRAKPAAGGGGGGGQSKQGGAAARPRAGAGTSSDAVGDAPQREQRKRSVPAHLRDAMAPDTHTGAFATCAKLLDTLMRHQWAWPFLAPVDHVKLGLTDYPRVVKRPMDLATIKNKLDAGAYASHEEFADDVRTTFLNALMYNAPGSDIHSMAERMKRKFEEQWRLLARQLAAESKAGAAAAVGDDGDSAPVPAPAPAESAKGKRKAAGGEAAKGKPATAAAPKKARLKGSGAGDSAPVAVPYSDPTSAQWRRRLGDMQADARTGGAALRAGTPAAPLTLAEQQELSQRMGVLDTDRLAKVVQVIAEHVPLNTNPATGDVEVELDAIDVSVQRWLLQYLRGTW